MLIKDDVEVAQWDIQLCIEATVLVSFIIDCISTIEYWQLQEFSPTVFSLNMYTDNIPTHTMYLFI